MFTMAFKDSQFLEASKILTVPNIFVSYVSIGFEYEYLTKGCAAI